MEPASMSDLSLAQLQRGIGTLQKLYNATGHLSGDEDYLLECAREELRRRGADMTTSRELRKSAHAWSKAKVERLVADVMTRAMRQPLQSRGERAALKLRDLLRQGGTLRKSVAGFVPASDDERQAHRSFGKAHSFFGKAGERYQDDNDLHTGNAHLADGLGHFESRDYTACNKAMKRADGHYAQAAERLAGDDDFSNGHAHFGVGMSHLSKLITFEGQTPQGSRLTSRNPASDANWPAKAGSAADMTKIADPAFTIATALCKQAQTEPRNMNPFHPEGANPGIPGNAMPDLGAAGGDLYNDEAMARSGNAAAIARIMGKAMRRQVLAVRR